MKKNGIRYTLFGLTIVIAFAILGYVYNAIIYRTLTLDNEKYHRVAKVKDYDIYEKVDFTCPNELEKIYEDDDYNYFFECYVGNGMLVKPRQEETPLYTVKDALEKDVITIDDLMSELSQVKKYAKEGLDNPFLDQPIQFSLDDYHHLGPLGEYNLFVKKGAYMPLHSVFDDTNLEHFYSEGDLNYYLKGYYSHYYVVARGDEVIYLPVALKQHKVSIYDLSNYKGFMNYSIYNKQDRE